MYTVHVHREPCQKYLPDLCTREESFDMVAARFDVLMGVVALFRASVAAGDVLVACPALRFVHFLLRHAFFFNPGPPKHLMSTHSGHFPQFGW